MKLKLIAAATFLLGITTTSFAQPLTSISDVLNVKKGETVNTDEAYSTVGLKKVKPESSVKHDIKNVRVNNKTYQS